MKLRLDTTLPISRPSLLVVDQQINPIDSADLVRCNKDIATLIKEIQTARALPKMVDLSNNTIAVAQQLHTHKTELEMLHRRAQNVKNKTKSLVINLQQGSKVASSFSTFPTTIAVQSLQELKPTLIGRVSFPSNSKTTTTSQIILTTNELERIHSVFVKSD